MSRRKLFLHDDEFINQKAEDQANDLWKKLNDKFTFYESPELKECISNIKITYPYLNEFVPFHKKYDDAFCMTAITKTHHLTNASLDIERCLLKRGQFLSDRKKRKFKINYVDYQFVGEHNQINFNNGDEYRDVYLMFFTKNVKETCKVLQRFDSLKAFI